MIFVVQLVLALFLFGVSLLLFLMIRQIGIMAQRIPSKSDPNAVLPLPVGAVVPVKEFVTYDLASHVDLTGGAVLLFASFSCPICNQVLTALHDSARQYQQSLILFILDRAVQKRYSNHILELKLDGFVIVEAIDLASQFQIRRLPFMYSVDCDGVIVDAITVVSVRELVDSIKIRFAPSTSTSEKEPGYVVRPRLPELARQEGKAVGDAGVEKVFAP